MISSDIFESACEDLLEELSKDPSLHKHDIGEDQRIHILTKKCELCVLDK